MEKKAVPWIQPLIASLEKSTQGIVILRILSAASVSNFVENFPDALAFDIIVFADQPSFRREFESKYRTKWDLSEPTKKLLIVLNQEKTTMPYDIETKGETVEFSLENVFHKIDSSVMAEVSSDLYTKTFEINQSLQDQPGRLSAEQTIEYLCRSIWGFDPLTVNSFEHLVSLLIDIHLLESKMPAAIIDHIVNQFAKRTPDGIDLRSWLVDGHSFFE